MHVPCIVGGGGRPWGCWSIVATCAEWHLFEDHGEGMEALCGTGSYEGYGRTMYGRHEGYGRTMYGSYEGYERTMYGSDERYGRTMYGTYEGFGRIMYGSYEGYGRTMYGSYEGYGYITSVVLRSVLWNVLGGVQMVVRASCRGLMRFCKEAEK